MDKQTVLVLEGTDGVGKTEIAKKLSEVLEIPYFKNPDEIIKLKWSNLEFKYRLPDQIYIASFLKQTRYSAIFDRAYPSEVAYSYAFGRDTDEELLTAIDQKFADLGAKIIICFKGAYSNYNDEQIPFDKIGQIFKGYLRFINKTKCDWLLLETSDEDLKREIDAILEWLE